MGSEAIGDDDDADGSSSWMSSSKLVEVSLEVVKMLFWETEGKKLLHVLSVVE